LWDINIQKSHDRIVQQCRPKHAHAAENMSTCAGARTNNTYKAALPHVDNEMYISRVAYHKSITVPQRAYSHSEFRNGRNTITQDSLKSQAGLP